MHTKMYMEADGKHTLGNMLPSPSVVDGGGEKQQAQTSLHLNTVLTALIPLLESIISRLATSQIPIF